MSIEIGQVWQWIRLNFPNLYRFYVLVLEIVMVGVTDVIMDVHKLLEESVARKF